MLSYKNPIVYKVNECELKQYSSLYISYYMSRTWQTGGRGRSAGQAANASNNRKERGLTKEAKGCSTIVSS
jgi:hypothetical protein